VVEEPILNDTEWEAELNRAMQEIRRGEYRRRKAMFRQNVSPWVV
jgi:hypothetical protein